MQRDDFPIVLQIRHICEILGFSKSTAYEMIKENGFPLLEINGRKIVYRDSFFAWLDAKEKKPVYSYDMHGHL